MADGVGASVGRQRADLVADGLPECRSGQAPGLVRSGFQIREQHLDRVEVRTAGRQEHACRAARLDPSRCGVSFARLSPPEVRGLVRPVSSQRPTRRITLVSPILKRLAASRRDRPSCGTTATGRTRRSSDRSLPGSHAGLRASRHDEAGFGPDWTPAAVQPAYKML